MIEFSVFVPVSERERKRKYWKRESLISIIYVDKNDDDDDADYNEDDDEIRDLN